MKSVQRAVATTGGHVFRPRPPATRTRVPGMDALWFHEASLTAPDGGTRREVPEVLKGSLDGGGIKNHDTTFWDLPRPLRH